MLSIEIAKFDQLPDTMLFKNLNGLVIFGSGIVTNAEGKPYRQFEKKPSKKSKTPCLKIVVRTKKYSWKQLTVARMVAELFVPNPQNLRHVRYKDGDFRNCDYRNLEWFDHASRQDRCKMTEKEIKAALKNMDKAKLSPINLAIYDFLTGDKNTFLKMYHTVGNTNYRIKVIKNALTAAFPTALYPTDYSAQKLHTYFDEVVLESLILRGYCVPKEEAADAAFWIYVRSYLNGLCKQFVSSPRLRAVVNGK